MSKNELLKLEKLLTKYYSQTKSPLGLSIIKPCLHMVKEKLQLINEDYSKETIMDFDFNSLPESMEYGNNDLA